MSRRPLVYLPLLAVACLAGTVLTTDADTSLDSLSFTEQFGHSLARAEVGELNEVDLAVGAIESDTVYLFDGPLFAPLGSQSLDTNDADHVFLGPTDSKTGFAMTTGNFLGSAHDDLVISAPWHNAWEGRIYIVPGGAQPNYKLASAATIDGQNGGDFAGWALTTGDFNGDGKDDLGIGSCGRATWRGAVYVFYGPITPGALDTSQADVAIGGGSIADRFGCALSAGDLDGDGTDELVVGASLETYNIPPQGTPPASNAWRPGAVHVFWDVPNASGFIQNIANQSRLSGSFNPIIGQAGVGHSVDATGDANGDGVNDLLVGAPQLDCTHVGYLVCQPIQWGTGYLLMGDDLQLPFPADAIIDDESNVVFEGGIAYDGVGNTVGFLGDLNKDGNDEVGIGTRMHLTHAWYGVTNIISTSPTQLRFVTDDHLTIDGTAEGRYAGRSLLSLGDLDNDGDDEFAVGGAGSSYFRNGAFKQGDVSIFRGEP